MRKTNYLCSGTECGAGEQCIHAANIRGGVWQTLLYYMQHGIPRTCGRVEMGAVLRSQGQVLKIGAVKRSRGNLTWGQAVKADFRGQES